MELAFSADAVQHLSVMHTVAISMVDDDGCCCFHHHRRHRCQDLFNKSKTEQEKKTLRTKTNSDN